MLSDMQAYEIECSGDENAVAALMELLEARKKIAAAERIIEYADGHPGMCCGQCSRLIHEAEERSTALAAALNDLVDDNTRRGLVGGRLSWARRELKRLGAAKC